jgi:hypothetical protein
MMRPFALAAGLTVLAAQGTAAQDRLQSLVTLYVKTGENRTKVGTGFAVAPGVFATAYHVVQGGRDIELVRDSGVVGRNVTIRNLTPEKDLALLEVGDLGNSPSLPIKPRIASVDEDLFMLGSAALIPNSTYTVRLSAINEAIEVDAVIFSFNLSGDASSIRVMLSTPRPSVLGPVTPNEINDSFMISSRSMFFASNWQRLKKLRGNLAERYVIDRALRHSVSRLGEVAGRQDLDATSTIRIRQAAQRIAASDPEVAADNFERQRDVDTKAISDALDTVLSKTAFKFSNLAEAQKYVDALQTCADLLNIYSVTASFGQWVPREKLYYEDAAKFLRRFRPVLVYVPE